MESTAKGPNLSPSHSRFKAAAVEDSAEILLEVLIGASSGESYPGRVVDLDLAEWADVLDVLIPALESHRDCARRGL